MNAKVVFNEATSFLLVIKMNLHHIFYLFDNFRKKLSYEIYSIYSVIVFS